MKKNKSVIICIKCKASIDVRLDAKNKGTRLIKYSRRWWWACPVCYPQESA